MGLDDTYPRELDDVVTKPLSIIFEKLWLSGEVLGTERRETSLPFTRKGGKMSQGATGQ